MGSAVTQNFFNSNNAQPFSTQFSQLLGMAHPNLHCINGSMWVVSNPVPFNPWVGAAVEEWDVASYIVCWTQISINGKINCRTHLGTIQFDLQFVYSLHYWVRSFVMMLSHQVPLLQCWCFTVHA